MHLCESIHVHTYETEVCIMQLAKSKNLLTLQQKA